MDLGRFLLCFIKGDDTGLMHAKYVMFCIFDSFKSVTGRYRTVFDVL